MFSIFKKRTEMEKVGRKGETLACRFLKKSHKMKILERNWKHSRDEIDIIARDGEVLVFVEVKTRRGERLVPAYYQAVTKRKKRALERASKAYLRQCLPKPAHLRFDVIEVKLCQSGPSDVKHYKNVSLFTKHFHA